MNLVLIDDEPRALRLLSSMIRSCSGQEKHSITTFSDPIEGYAFVLNNPCDGVFLDIEMPELTGIQFAERLKRELQDLPALIFVTAYPQFSLKAWDVDAEGYILKPYDDDQIARALNKISRSCQIRKKAPDKPFIRCFPEFDVFVNGYPVSFSSKRSKELLALLVHHRGGWVPLDKITFLLLEEASEESAKSHVRTLLSRLRQSLAKYGLDGMVESSYGNMRVLTDIFECDYYQYLDGRNDLFKGEYMGTYVWAEEERAYMAEHR